MLIMDSTKEMKTPIGAETVQEDSQDQGKQNEVGNDGPTNQIPDTRVEMEQLQQQKENKGKKKKKRKFRFIRKMGCMSLEDDVQRKPDVDRSFNVEASSDSKGKDHEPTHLIVMVHGIIGSADNWKYAAKQFVKAHPNHVLVHCSQSNSSMLTLDGVDVMGKRLADEVISVVDSHPNLQKISFIGHSLGGLISRYAIALLYQQDLRKRKSGEETGECDRNESNKFCVEQTPEIKIAGLEPVNFITCATPHLGARGHKQVPVFCGLHNMEKVASRASFLLGRTGKHLFLRDGGPDGKPPLLLQMSSDSEDLKFISALRSFRRRVVYSNTRFDPLVGWSSSSLRRRSELPKRRYMVKDSKYPHIVKEEMSRFANPQQGSSLEGKVSRSRTRAMEEAMLRGLTRLSWERVDVSFSGSIQRLFAHSTIQVKTYCINYHGADVIQHMIDNFHL